MRLFIAIELPDDIKEKLIECEKKIKYARTKKISKGSMHLTIKFLGEVELTKANRVRELLRDVKFDPFKVHIEGIGAFPEKGPARVVWIGFSDTKMIASLQKKIDNALSGLFPKDENFHPHLTIARIKFIENKKAFKENIGNIKIGEGSFEVDKFMLIKSTLTPDGPVHEVLEEY